MPFRPLHPGHRTQLAWVADHEPEIFPAARWLLMPASKLATTLTGEYVLDHHSASQCTSRYDTDAQTADRALKVKATVFAGLGVQVHLCGTVDL